MTEQLSAVWPVTIRFDQVTEKGFQLDVAADPDACAAIAAFAGVERMSRFAIRARITRWRRLGLKVIGDLHAEFQQISVVSLEPFEASLREEIAAVFVPEGSKLDRIATTSDGELVLDPEGDDIPETFDGFQLDVGRLALEYFVLGLDPHPKRDGEHFAAPSDESSEPDEEPSPFAALAKLAGDSTAEQ